MSNNNSNSNQNTKPIKPTPPSNTREKSENITPNSSNKTKK